MALIVLVLVFALFNALAFWQRHIFIYCLIAVPDMIFGLFYAWQSDPFKGGPALYSPTFLAGLCIFILGCFMAVRATVKAIQSR